MKKTLLPLILLPLLSYMVIFLIFADNASPAPDPAAINDAAMTALAGEDPTETVNLLSKQLLDQYEQMDTSRKNRDFILRIFLYVYTTLLFAAILYLYLYCERSILKPFRGLQRFAQNVASGNLDIPLEMDPHGRFGAFTESFDLMREELHRARENERNVNRSKKELVASLSHDIKTPVASIKAVTELMLVSAHDDKTRLQLEKIGEKAEQINTLITDMFHATLEELQALHVTPTEIPSTLLPNLIQSADYKSYVSSFQIPDCIILADPIRLQQVFDNLIGNSYKYAGTPIEIHTDFEDAFLIINITDSGPGVTEEDIPLLFNKFYRGQNANDKSGYGLGLYISRYLLEQMSGKLDCINRPDGFIVSLKLLLAG